MGKERMLVTGGHSLEGHVRVSGGKNTAVAVIPATLLCDEPCTIENLPDIEDVHALADILRAKGCPKVALNDLTRDDQAEGVEDAFRYGKMVMAAASYDAGLFTPAYDFLHKLQAKGYQNRKVALIENGTWAPSAGRVMKEMFAAMKNVEVVGNMVTIKSTMNPADLPALEALADAILNA